MLGDLRNQTPVERLEGLNDSKDSLVFSRVKGNWLVDVLEGKKEASRVCVCEN